MLIVVILLYELVTGSVAAPGTQPSNPGSVAAQCNWELPTRNSTNKVSYHPPYDKIKIRTNSMESSWEYVGLQLVDLDGGTAKNIRIMFSRRGIEYSIGGCMTDYQKLTVTPPASTATRLPTAKQDKIWQIAIGDKRVVITCEDIEVINLHMSSDTCSDPEWQDKWSKDITYLYFYFFDNAAKNYCIYSDTEYCATLDSTWENVVTEPRLPVDTGTEITLSCREGYTKTGGSRARCDKGTIVPTLSRPQCHVPVDGGWSTDNDWTPCSTYCGGGVRTTLRSCDNPEPRHGGKQCSGETLFYESCNTQLCLDYTSGEYLPKELVTKPCRNDDTEATNSLLTRRKAHACDGDPSTFYQSEHKIGESPFFTVQLDKEYTVRRVVVVNVHTGVYCKSNAESCTKRLHGAKVEVLSGNGFSGICGEINVNNHILTTEAQTYSIECGINGLEGDRVRIRLENAPTESKPLEIAEIYVKGHDGNCGKRSLSATGTVASGTDALVGDHPWTVQVAQNRYTCGGTIIDEYWVITAVHCITAMDDSIPIMVYFGFVDRSDVGAGTAGVREAFKNEAIFHPKDSVMFNLDYDIALLKINEPFPLSRTGNVNKICLSRAYSLTNNYVITGWGKVREWTPELSEILQTASASIASRAECNQYLSKSARQPSKGTLCTRENNHCEGDSGGPLMYQDESDFRYWIAGVISWTRKCGNVREFGGISNVVVSYEWITTTIGNLPR